MLFSIALLSMILITSQAPAAFAGAGIWEDKDNDGYSTEQGDCDDNDPNVYPVDGRCVTTIEIEADVSGGVVVGSDEQVIISNSATVYGNLQVNGGAVIISGSSAIDGDLQVNGGTVIIGDSSTIKGNIVSNGGSILIEEGSVIEGNVDIVVSGDGGVLEINGGIVSGNLITNGIDTLTITDSNINGNIYSENDGDVTITENTVNGNIEIINPAGICYESENDVNGNNSSCHLSS